MMCCFRHCKRDDDSLRWWNRNIHTCNSRRVANRVLVSNILYEYGRDDTCKRCGADVDCSRRTGGVAYSR